MKRIITILISCILILSLVSCGSSSSTSTSSKTTLHSGQSITLKDDTLVCSSKNNLDKMLSFMSQKNKDGQNQMLLNGQATILSKGTKVNVTSVGITTEVESNGKKWYAPMEVFQ